MTTQNTSHPGLHTATDTAICRSEQVAGTALTFPTDSVIGAFLALFRDRTVIGASKVEVIAGLGGNRLRVTDFNGDVYNYDPRDGLFLGPKGNVTGLIVIVSRDTGILFIPGGT